MMGIYGEGWQYGMGFGFHWIFFLAFWGLLIWGAISLARVAGRPSAAAAQPPAALALDLLAERYARGELTREEFTRMKKELGDIAPRKSK